MLIKNCTVAFQLTQSSPFTRAQFLRIAERGVNTEYAPRRFHAIIMRLRSGQRTTAALIFQSGRVVLTGVPHPRDALTNAQRVRRRVQHSLGGDELSIHNIRVVNVVGVHTMPYRVAVEAASTDARFSQTIYDPSIFPALRCKLPNHSTTCLVYISGKIIVTGARTIAQLQSTFHTLLSIIQQYRR